MNTHDTGSLKQALLMLAVPLILFGCASTEDRPSDAERVRAELTELQSDPQLATRAPVAIREAERAVIAAENAEEDDDAPAEHLAFIAHQRIEIAKAQAQQRLYEDDRERLIEERDRSRLEARTREAEMAREEARLAAQSATQSQEEAAELRRQMEELNAKPTERGMVLTLGDVLFETNEYVIKPGAHNDLDRLAEFLKRYEDRDVRIEGHTDSTGDENYNMELSERRADAVRTYLVSQGISPRRIVSTGRGETTPIASNRTTGGRQLNRRVEIIIGNEGVAMK